MVFGELGDKVNNIANGGNVLGNIMLKVNPLLAKLGYALKIFMYVALAVVVCVVIYKFWLRYKDKVEIFLLSGSSIVGIHESAARVYEDKTDNTKRIEVQKRYKGIRLNFPLVPGKYKYIEGKKDKYFLWLDDNMQIQAAEIDLSKLKLLDRVAHKIKGGSINFNVEDLSKEEIVHITPRPQDRDAWRNMEVKKQRDKLKSDTFFDKYGAMLVNIAAYAIAFLLFYFAFKELGVIGNSIGGGLQAIAEKCLGK